MRSVLALILALSLSGTASSVLAGPINWTLEDMGFQLGGARSTVAIVSGDFMYDADLNLYSNINFAVTITVELAGSVFYVMDNPVLSLTTPTNLNVEDLTGPPYFALNLQFAAPLSNAGGNVTTDAFFVTNNGTATFFAPDLGSVVADVQPPGVPEPASLFLVGLALAALGFTKRGSALAA